MKTRKFQIPNKAGQKLTCIEVLPSEPNGKKFPVVIFAHGFAYFKEEDGIFVEEANRLAQHGYACYYFDFSGCGESEGNYEQTTLTKLAEDLHAVYDYVMAIDYIDSADVSLIGHSFGTCVINAAQITHVQRIVLGGSPFYPYESLKNLFPDFNEDGISTRIGSKDENKITTIGAQFWADLKTYKPEELIKSFACPILFIHGKQDTIVPIENMEKVSSLAQRPQRLVLEQSTHDFNPERETAFAAIIDFFPTS